MDQGPALWLGNPQGWEVCLIYIMLEAWAEAYLSRFPKDTNAAAAKRAHRTLEISGINFRQKFSDHLIFFFFFKRGLFATTCYTLRCVDWKGDLLPHFDVFLTSPAGFGIRTYCFVFLGNNGVHPLHFKSAPDSRLLRDEWVGAWDKAQKNSASENLHENNDSLGRAEAEIGVVDMWQ